MTRPSEAAGFTVIELLIASGITVIVTLLACRLAVDAQTAWRADSARVDLQQRARVAVDTVTRALMEAGGGPYAGGGRGPLLRVLPPILPRWSGARGADGPEEFRTDQFTVTGAVSEAEHGSLLLGAAPGASLLELAPSAGCALPACGFTEGSTLMLVTADGTYAVFSVTAVDGMALTVRHHGPGITTNYPPGTPAISIKLTTLAHSPAQHALRQYDGESSDLPLVDDVVGMEVRYFGDVQPPLWPKPRAGDSNCLYGSDGAFQGALMPVFDAPGGLAELTGEALTDGPWCGSGATRYDADLLRVRRVRVSLRLQASDPAARGPDRRFHNPGHARSSAAMAPDITVTVDVAPRNLLQGW